MTIEIKRNYGFEIIIEADNVKIVEDIEEREYQKGADGKIDFKTPPRRDVKDDAISQFVSVTEDLIYYREKEFDSSSLIERLFEKLPSKVAINLAAKLEKEYQVELE